jgi:hypothetical protein
LFHCSPDKNAAHNSTFPGPILSVGSTKNAGFITRGPTAVQTPERIWLGRGQSGSSSVRPWGLSARSSTALISDSKARPTPTIHSKVFVFVLARGGCGRGASALLLKASVARRFASQRRSFLLGGLEGRSALQCMRSKSARRALLFLRSEAEQRERLGLLHSFWDAYYEEELCI